MVAIHVESDACVDLTLYSDSVYGDGDLLCIDVVGVLFGLLFAVEPVSCGKTVGVDVESCFE
jgi:hypothetical protein